MIRQIFPIISPIAMGLVLMASAAGAAERIRPGGAGERIIERGERLAPRTPGVVYATSSIKCGDRVYEVSTGNNKGQCSVRGVEGEEDHMVNCSTADGKNVANATCALGCGDTNGSGSCKIKVAK